MNLGEALSEFTGLTPEQVMARANASEKKLAEMWHAHKGPTIDFYKDNEEYLFNLLLFNQSEFYPSLIGRLIQQSGKRILDIGSGLGTMALIAAHDNSVVGWEINRPCRKFSQFLASRCGIRVEFPDTMPELSQFDIVAAVDTLEHIEDLQGFLKMLGEKMRFAAQLYHVDCFDNHDGLYPMHFIANNHVNEWLEESGFKILGPVWAMNLGGV